MTKIDIFSGFLGAGKTTLIKKLIAEAYSGEKLVLIENEFGEINIDGGFLKESGIEISEMSAGCICCSLVGDFNKALKEVVAQFHPDRILIEPSGVGKLSDVIVAVERTVDECLGELKLNSYVTVADASKVKVYMKNFGEFYNNQIEYAGTVILSRTQNVSADKLDACLKMIREKNEEASIITTPWDDIQGKNIVEAMEKVNSLEKELLEEHEHHHDGECGCGHHHDHDHHEHGPECTCGCHDHDHHHDHHADEVFTSWGKETAKKFADADMEQILKTLADNADEYGIILRAKGIVPNTDGEWIHFDLTPGEYEIRKGAADYTGKLCVIGSNLKEDKLAELFGVA